MKLFIAYFLFPSFTSLALTSSMHRPRTVLITGATDGIGRNTAERLASDKRYAILVHGRKPKTDSVVKSLIKDLQSRGAVRVAYVQADLNDLQGVADLAENVKVELQAWQELAEPHTPSLDVLINNAGIFDPEPRFSAQGYDSTMAVNVLAPFVLTRKLLPSLVRGKDARIITTSSISQSRELPNIDQLFAKKVGNSDFDVQPLRYSAHSFYSYSKLGDLLFTVQLANVLSTYQINQKTSAEKALTLLENMRRIQCLTMDPGTVNTKMLLAGWGSCGIPVSKADNTYKLATGEEYAWGRVDSGSYHFGLGASRDASDATKLNEFWNKLSSCTGYEYDDLSDCL